MLWLFSVGAYNILYINSNSGKRARGTVSIRKHIPRELSNPATGNGNERIGVMAIGVMANGRPAAKGKTATATKPKAQNAASGKKKAANKAQKKPAQNKSTAAKAAAKPALTSAAVQKIQANAAQAERNKLKAAGWTPAKQAANKKKPATKAKKKKGKNGAESSALTRWLPGSIARNPTARQIGALLVAGAFVVGGGAVARIIAAVVLLVGDKISFTRSLAGKTYAAPVVTFVTAFLAFPLIGSTRFMRRFVSTESLGNATAGGVGFAIAEGVGIATGKPDFIGDAADRIRRGSLLVTGDPVGDATAQAALRAGATPKEATAAAASAMGTLRGIREGNGGGNGGGAKLRYRPQESGGGTVARKTWRQPAA